MHCYPADRAERQRPRHGASPAALRSVLQAHARLRFAGGFDARTDTHHETERALRSDLVGPRRCAVRRFAVRRLSATYTRGKLTIEAGKQFIRWGKTDVLNPTDRFAPRDF